MATSEFAINPGEGWDTVTTCPAGKSVVGGGFFFGSDPGVLVDISRPTSDGTGWHVHALNSSSQAHTVTGYAVCAAVTVQTVTAEFTINPGEGWDAVAACPSGTAPTGGGFFFGSDPGVLLDISRPATNESGWHVHATNFSSQTHTVTTYGVCGALPGHQVVTAEFTINPGEGWDAVAACPSGTAPTGGGFFFGSDPGVLLDISRPATNGSGWHVHATNFSSQTHTVTAYGVCGTA